MRHVCGTVVATVVVDVPTRSAMAVEGPGVIVVVGVVDVSTVLTVVLSEAGEEELTVDCGVVVVIGVLLVGIPEIAVVPTEDPVGVVDTEVVLTVVVSKAGEVKVEAVDGGTVVVIAVLVVDISVRVDETVEEPVDVVDVSVALTIEKGLDKVDNVV